MQKIMIFISENKKKLLIVLAIIIVFSGITYFMNRHKENKIYFSDPYVYVKDSYIHYSDFKSELPYINVKGDEIKKVNNEITNKYYEVLEFEENMMKYDYYINDNILSLIIKLYYLSSPDSYPDIIIYNIDIENKVVLSNSDMLDLFDISSYDVSEIINNKLKDYYNYEINKGYISNSCDFDCYLSNTYSLPLDKCDYYIKNDTLYAYKRITLDRDFYYDVNSGFDFFNFKIKDL